MKRSIRKKILGVTAIFLLAVTTLIIIPISAAESADLDSGSTPEIQVTLDGSTNLSFLYSSLGDADSIRVTERLADGTELDSYTVSADGMTPNKDGKYAVKIRLAAAEMTNNITVYTQKNGEKLGKAYTYSVKKYADEVLANEGFASYHAAIKAMLNYGAMAQTHFNVNTSALANADLYRKNTNPINAVSTVNCDAASYTKDLTRLAFTGYEAVLESSTAFRIYFTYSGEGTPTATVVRKGIETQSTSVHYDAAKSSYYVSINNIAPTLYNAQYTVNVTGGGETLEVKASILNYVKTVLESSTTTDTQKNAVRAMYNHFIWTTDDTSARPAVTACAHSSVHQESANKNTATAYYCSVCGVKTQTTLPDSVEVFYGPDALNTDYNLRPANRGGLTPKSEIHTDAYGTVYVRMYGGGGTHTPDNKDDDYNDSRPFSYDKNVITGKYAIIKYRLPEIQPSGTTQPTLNLHLCVQEATDWKSQQIKTSETGEWITVVMDLSQLSPTAVVPNADGKYKGVSIWFQHKYASGLGSTEDYIDVAYFAYCDKLSDAIELVDQQSYQIHTSATAYSTVSVADECTKQHKYIETGIEKQYIYVCTECGKTADFDADRYFSHTTLNGLVKPYLMDPTIQYDENNDLNYIRYTGRGSAGQVNYFRQPISYENKDNGTQSVNPNFGTNPAFNVKQSKYLALMYRTNNTSGWNHYMWLGTENANTIVKGDDNKYTGSSNYAAVRLPLSKLTANEWSLMVIDLEQALGDKWIPNGNGEFVIESMLFHSGSVPANVYFDVSYIAFADSLEDIAELSGSKECLLVTKTTTGAENTANEGNMYANYFIGNDVLEKKEAYLLKGTKETEGELSYMHYVGQGVSGTYNPGQVNYYRLPINPDSGATGYKKGEPFNVGKSRYIAMMFRTNNTSWYQQMWLGTKNANTMVSDANATNKYTGESGMHKFLLPFSDVTANEWTLFVLDMEAILGDDFVADANGDYIIETLLFHSSNVLTTTNFDVQYFAFADSFKDIINITGREDAILVTANNTGKKVDLNINHMITADSLSKTKPFQMNMTSLMADGEISFIRYTGQDQICEANYYRHPIQPNSDGTADQSYSSSVSFNIGKAKYLTLMYRTNYTAWSHRIYLGTEDANTVKYNESTKRWEGSSNRQLIELPISKINPDTWTLLVIDLEKVLGNGWIANENGDYIIENLCFYANPMLSSTTFDVSYMMFTDTLDDIKKATGRSNIMYIEGSNKGSFADLDNKCIGDTIVHTTSTSDCTVAAYCSICGAKVRDSIEHVYNLQKATNDYLATRATQDTKGTYYYSCLCGARGSETFAFGKTLSEMTDLTKTERFKTLASTITDGGSFLYFTDPHFISAAPDGKLATQYEYHIDIMGAHFNATPASFAISGGDWFNRSNTRQNAIQNLKDIDARMNAAFGKNFYLVIGNHDYNYQTEISGGGTGASEHRLSSEEIVSAWYTDERYGANGKGNKAYYSFFGANTKFYVFDSETDWEHPNTETVSEYDKEQITWFLEQLLKNDDAHIALAPHILYSAGMTLHGGTAKLLEYSNVYNNRGSVTYEGETYDFSDKSGRVEFLIAGHTHKDEVSTHYNIPCVLVIHQQSSAVYPTFDMVAVDYKDDVRKLYTFRVGADTADSLEKLDRVIELGKKITSAEQ